MTQHPILKAPFAARAEKTTHPLNSYLLRLMEVKKSNLCLSADVSTAHDLLRLADEVGPSIVVLKTHYDVVSGWDFHPHTGTGARLASLARRHGFLIFEDRKFGDIGNTVQMQYVGGSARVIDWAHIINVNMLPGKASVSALADAAAKWHERYPYEVRTSVTVGTPRSDAFDEEPPMQNGLEAGNAAEGDVKDGRKGSIVSVTTVTQHYEPADSPRLTKSMAEGDEVVFPGIEEAPADRGLLILAQMSTMDNLADERYTRACVEAARENPGFVMGFISQENLNTEAGDAFLSMTPGCQLPPEGEDGVAAGDGKGQQYNTPKKLVVEKGVDVVIVGRGILKAADQKAEAERYRRAAWDAYQERVR